MYVFNGQYEVMWPPLIRRLVKNYVPSSARAIGMKAERVALPAVQTTFALSSHLCRRLRGWTMLRDQANPLSPSSSSTATANDERDV